MVQPSARVVHFLLIEDDDDHADLVIRALEQNRVVNTVHRVRDGVEAMDHLRSIGDGHSDAQRPDVILLDLRLPRKDGHEVLHEIKEDESLRSIPVVVLTTSQSEIDRAEAYSSYVNSYLVKPLDFDRFNEMIHHLGMYWAVWNEPPTARSRDGDEPAHAQV